MFGLNYALTYLAETHLASGLVAVLFGTMPFFIFAFAHFMIGERADRNTILGALLALGGVALISLVGNVRGDVLYVLAALVASASSGYANVYLKLRALRTADDTAACHADRRRHDDRVRDPVRTPGLASSHRACIAYRTRVPCGVR
jgi:drug/metabolite transporter (DMT)-like permease